ncbi:calcineurin-like metallo-phosphoesterase superfamily protein isoform X2 [Tasmannia lanceolata]|uniref:calcineurin-like metallo-phosphoesterase superfamily protein isoform X2 n=1 Tax=Tasmannia lanceolata TaxID=3420 RepID=UPI004062A9CF
MMGNGRDRPSWAFTLLIQVSLCIALYIAFYLGSPQRSGNGTRRALDLYFLSVRVGHRPSNQQTQLLKQGTLHFPSLKIPWYTTRASEGQEIGYFLKQITLPHEQMLDIIGIDTGSLHGSLHMKQPSDTGSDQLHWLMKTLAATDSKWRIVVGYHPLVVCEERKHAMEATKIYDPLHHIFLKYGVNAYLSKQGCTGHYTLNEGIAYIGNPGNTDENQNGFLLHRVTPLEIVSYYINSANEVVFKSKLHQRGREAM